MIPMMGDLNYYQGSNGANDIFAGVSHYKSAQYDEWKRKTVGSSNKIDYRNRRAARLILRWAATNSTSSNRFIV